jgi:hypothetical protein
MREFSNTVTSLKDKEEIEFKFRRVRLENKKTLVWKTANSKGAELNTIVAHTTTLLKNVQM